MPLLESPINMLPLPKSDQMTLSGTTNYYQKLNLFKFSSQAKDLHGYYLQVFKHPNL